MKINVSILQTGFLSLSTIDIWGQIILHVRTCPIHYRVFSRVGHDWATSLSLFTHALEKEMATHSSVLSWRIPGAGEPGRLQSMGSLRVWHDWATSLSLFTHTLEKEMATHSSVLAWRIPGTGEPGGLQSMGSQSRTRLKRLSSSSSICWRLPILGSHSALLCPSPTWHLYLDFSQCLKGNMSKIEWILDLLP